MTEKVKERRPAVAALLSLVVMGLGQLYNGQIRRAVVCSRLGGHEFNVSSFISWGHDHLLRGLIFAGIRTGHHPWSRRGVVEGSPSTMMRFAALAATIVASVNFVASSAFAFHPGSGGRGGVSIDVILPVLVAVVLGMVGLGIWGRKKRKTKSKRKHKRKRR